LANEIPMVNMAPSPSVSATSSRQPIIQAQGLFTLSFLKLGDSVSHRVLIKSSITYSNLMLHFVRLEKNGEMRTMVIWFAGN